MVPKKGSQMARDITDQLDEMQATIELDEQSLLAPGDAPAMEQPAPELIEVVEGEQPIATTQAEPLQVAGVTDIFELGGKIASKAKARVAEAEKRVIPGIPQKPIQKVGTATVVRQADAADIAALDEIIGGDYTKGLNLPSIMTASGEFDLAGYMAKVKDLNQDLFETARRGTLNYETLLQLAEQQGTDRVLQKWLTRDPGRGDTAEDVLAALILARDLTRQTTKKFDEARSANDPEARRQLFAEAAQYMTMEFTLYSNLSGATSEAGRLLYAMQQAQKIGVDTRRGNELLKILEQEGIDVEHLGELYMALPHAAKPQMVNGLFSKGADVLTEVFINSILSSPVTHAVNVAGNGMFSMYKGVEETVAGGIGFARTSLGIGGKDRVYVREGLMQIEGLFSSFNDALIVSGKAFLKEEAGDFTSKIDVRNRRAIGTTGDVVEIYKQAREGNYSAAAVNTLGTAVRMSGRFLLAEDEFFKAISYRASVKKQAFARSMALYDEMMEAGKTAEEANKAAAAEFTRIINDPPEAVQESAGLAAKELTFQGDLDGFLGTMQSTMSHPAVKLFGIPFFKTPVNVTKEVGARSPLVLAHPKFMEDIKAGGRRADMAMAKFTLGTGIMGTFAMTAMGLNGPRNQVIIMGAGPTDPHARQAMMRMNIYPHTVNIRQRDGTYKSISYSRLDPLSGMLAMAADYAYYVQYEEDAGVAANLATAVGLGMYNYTMELPFLEGAAQFSEIITNPDPAIAFDRLQAFFAERAATAALSAVPTVSSFGATVERVQDPYASNTMMPAGRAPFTDTPITELPPYMRGFYTALQKAKARHPLFSKDVPPSYNLWGERRMQGKGVGYELWSPIRIQDAKYAGVDKELMSLGDGIAMPDKTINRVLLNADQYNYMIEAMNQKRPGKLSFLEAMEKTIYSEDYKALKTKEDKLMQLRNVAERYKKIGRDAVQARYPSLRERVLKR